MVEKRIDTNHEVAKNVETLKDTLEIQEQLQEQIESRAEKAQDNENKTESARHEAMEQAVSAEEEKKAAVAEKIDQEQRSQSGPTKQDLDQSFNKTMSRVQKDMDPASRTFSKVIHNPVVDKVSNAVGNTVARPNIILAGALGALILGSALYMIAKNFGYVLSGFEAIGAFALGWAVGAIIEFARVGLSGGTKA